MVKTKLHSYFFTALLKLQDENTKTYAHFVFIHKRAYIKALRISCMGGVQDV